jgi:hypothetical protein
MPANATHAELTATIEEAGRLLDLAFSEGADYPDYVRSNVRRVVVDFYNAMDNALDDYVDGYVTDTASKPNTQRANNTHAHRFLDEYSACDHCSLTYRDVHGWFGDTETSTGPDNSSNHVS